MVGGLKARFNLEVGEKATIQSGFQPFFERRIGNPGAAPGCVQVAPLALAKSLEKCVCPLLSPAGNGSGPTELLPGGGVVAFYWGI